MKLLSASDVGELCGVSEYEVVRWSRAGICPVPRLIGGHARWPAAELEAWAAAGYPQSPPPARKVWVAFSRAHLAETEQRAAEIERQLGHAEV